MLNIYQLEQQIEARMHEGHVPGLALAIVKDQQVLYARGFGVTSVEDGGLPVTPQTLFRIGSVTKPLTGSAVLRLVEEGKLDLDRPVKDYVEWLTFSEAGLEEHITLRLLVSHSAGLPTAAQHFGSRDPSGLERYIREELPTLPLIAPPGKVWSYSNPGIILVGYILEKVGGKPYTALMQELVFDPLEMKRTTFDPMVAMTYPLAQSHDLHEDGTLSVQHRFADNTAHYPAGFVMSTVLDMANFALMFMNQGRFHDRQVLSPMSVAAIQTPQASLYTTTGAGYGLTMDIDSYKNLQWIGHTGGISTFGSQLVMVPDSNLAIVILFNRLSPDLSFADIMHSILDQLLDLPAADAQPQPIEPDRTLWQLYTGNYLGQFTGLAEIQVVDEQLTLNLNGEKHPLHALKKDLYFARKPEGEVIASIGFPAEEAGPVQFLVVNSSPCKRIGRDASFAPDPAELHAYEGKYVSEVGTLTITADDRHLYVHEEDKRVACVALSRTRFACEWGLLDFYIAEDGAAASFTFGGTFNFVRVSS